MGAISVSKHVIYMPGVYNPPIGHYTQSSVPDHVNPAVFIGKDGCYLKKITERSGAEYLWFDDRRRVIEIWGAETSVSAARALVEKRFKKFSV